MYLGAVKFLIVDDNQFMRGILLQVLHALGASEIREAENGRAAMEAMRTWRPDIAVVDWEMAPVNGLELVRWIRGGPEGVNRFIPVIMLTAHSELGRVAAARDAGVTEYVVKPVSAKVMWSRIRAVVERPRRFIKTKVYFGPDRRRQDVETGRDERRGGKDAAPQAMPRADAPMSQDAINAYFNPDSEGDDEGEKKAS